MSKTLVLTQHSRSGTFAYTSHHPCLELEAITRELLGIGAEAVIAVSSIYSGSSLDEVVGNFCRVSCRDVEPRDRESERARNPVKPPVEVLLGHQTNVTKNKPPSEHFSIRVFQRHMLAEFFFS